MHVDRSRFLFLTASLAAAACNQTQPATTPDTGGVDPARSHDSTSASEPGSTTGNNPSVWLEIEPGTEDRPAEATDPNCNNQVGSPATCSLSPPAGHCESFESTQMLCSSFANFMQPRAAEAAVDCMLAASGTPRICEWELWNECTGAGMQASCTDPATRSTCESISSHCGGSLDVFTCQQALSSVRPQHVNHIATCVQEFCEVDFCVFNLGQF